MKRPNGKRKVPVGFPKQPSKPRDSIELKLLREIGKRIYKDLHRRSKSVEWLGFESETSRATVRRILDGDRNIGVVTINRVVRALGYADVIDFFKKF
jgi:hypothetical protein